MPPPPTSDRQPHLSITVQADPAPAPSPSLFPSVAPARTASTPSVPSLGFRTHTMRSSTSPASTSPSRIRAHARGASTASVGGATSAGGAARTAAGSVARWRNLVASQIAQIQREGWRNGLFGKARLRGSGGSGVEAALKKGFKGFAALWVTEGDEKAAAQSHLHGDSDLPPSAVSAAARRSSPFGLSRLSIGVVVLLFLLGLSEVILSSSSSSSSSSGARRRLTAADVSRSDPFAVLRTLSPPPSTKLATSLPGHDRLWRARPGATADGDLDAYLNELEEGDTTAVVLHWKRTDNVKVILAHLCQYSMFESVLVWNNNPDVFLTRETFASSRCPPHKLRIYNSPRNLLFFARYLACASHSSSPYCFFQDDDWVVQPVRAMYAQFKRDPEGPIVVSTNSEVATLYGLEWCFFNSPLHTCFSWVGTGAFTSRTHVERFLATITYLGYSRDELAHADNSFATFMNEPPYVIESRLAQLPDKGGHSEGEGISRNKAFIHQGLQRLVSFLDADFPSSAALPSAPRSVDVSPYRSSLSPPLPPHPYAHHARAPCFSVSASSPRDSADPQCLFLTNLALLPPPDAVPYPGPDTVGSLQRWEEHLGHTARGWMEGGEMWSEEENWKRRWSYDGAVDGDPSSAFRSMDVVREGDYVGLGLLAPLDPAWIPRVTLHVLLEDALKVLKAVVVEVSTDGYRWSTPHLSRAARRPTFTCSPSSYRSTRPDTSFPDSRLLSPLAHRLRRQELALEESTGALGRWWRRRRRSVERVKECTVELSARLASTLAAPGAWVRAPEHADAEEGEEEMLGGEGWRFVRLVVQADGSGRERQLDTGWGVYELWLTAVGNEGQ
ncbi:hypothetical protein JCM8097_005558 [Rhodosporidiobolus ruineniae]